MMRAKMILFCLASCLLSACGDDGEGDTSSTPVPTITPTPSAPNQFGFTDGLLRVGAARESIAPVRAGSAEAIANPDLPSYETFTDFDFTLVCPGAPEVQLHFEPNSLFDGVLTRPLGSEPWLDCAGTVGRFDAAIDVYRDLNGNGRFDGDHRNPEGLEPFSDVNGNGNFDAIWMGGFDSARAAQGVNAADPPEVTAMVLSQGREFTVLVTLDTIGNVSTHLNPLRQRIAQEIGLDGSAFDTNDVQRIVVSSLHNHEAADTLGVAGPTAINAEAVRDVIIGGLLPNLGPFAGVPVQTGINFSYRDYIDDQVVAAVEAAIAGLKVAELRAAKAPAPMESDEEALHPDPTDQTQSFRIPPHEQMLMTDIRWPFVRDPLVLAFQAREVGTGQTIVTMANWTNHVEVLGSRNDHLTADYAGYVRQRLETNFGGVGIFTIGTVGGLQTPLQDVFVPLVDASGNVALAAGGTRSFAELYRPVLDGTGSASSVASELSRTAQRAINDAEEKSASLGYITADVASQALLRQSFSAPAQFQVRAASVLIPLENPTLFLGALLGVVEGREQLYLGIPSPALVSDRPDQCGLIGCIKETITMVDFGSFQFLTSPGELLPEYVLGRPRGFTTQDEHLHFVQKDAGGQIVHDFGVNEFAPIAGLREMRGDDLFLFGLAQGQLGYFIPRSDWVNVFEGSLPRPEDIDAAVGFLANLDVAPLLGLYTNPGFGDDEQLTVRQIIESAWAKFPESRYPATPLGGVSLTDIPNVSLASDHPNVIGNNNSLGPRVGHVVYNAMCDLLDDSITNNSCSSKLPVDNDPN